MSSHSGRQQLAQAPADISESVHFRSLEVSDFIVLFSALIDTEHSEYQEAWERLVLGIADDLRSSVLQSLWKRGISDEYLDDIVQETLITALLKIGQFNPADGAEKFYRWIVVIAQGYIANIRRDLYRANERELQKAVLLRDVGEDEDEVFENYLYAHILEKYRDTPEDVLLFEELTEALVDVLNTVSSERDREILVRCFVNGEKPHKVAADYFIQPASVSTLLYRKKKELKAILEEKGIHPP